MMRVFYISVLLVAAAPAFGDSSFEHDEQAARIRRAYQARQEIEAQRSFSKPILALAAQLATMAKSTKISPEQLEAFFKEVDKSIPADLRKTVFNQITAFSGLTVSEGEIVSLQYVKHLRNQNTGNAAALLPQLAGIGDSSVNSLLRSFGSTPPPQPQSTTAPRSIRSFSSR
jgi:hypothetical protein